MAEGDSSSSDVKKSVNSGSLLLSVIINSPPIRQIIEDLICAPLKSLDELNNWHSNLPHPTWARQVIRLQQRSKSCISGSAETTLTRHDGKSVPKTLFCHDYKGGYQEDALVDGSDKCNEYRFFHWAGIDTFVYFSHHFVTIPPLSWINAAHRHGVKVLGTLITEWTNGMAVWKKILVDDASINRATDNLAAICEYFGFEGYLMNIENEIVRAEIPRLEFFLKSLRQKLRSLVPNAQLIWYDSVTEDGVLKWQNRLNKFNQRFFNACDGIFLNYGWKEEDLVESVEAAGVRSLDVYVGIDVFGRGVYGGGGFNSNKAFQAAREQGLSVALFAPGWVHETQPPAFFTSLEYLYWQKVWPYLYIHGPRSLPFSTSFCQGYGINEYNHGVATHKPWYNLRRQEYQPTIASDINETLVQVQMKESITLPDYLLAGSVQHYQEDGYNGGGCLKIQTTRHFCLTRQESQYHRLFVCSFERTRRNLLFTTTTKCDSSSGLDLVLIVEDRWGSFSKVTLTDSTSASEDNEVLIPSLKSNELLETLRENNVKIDPSAAEGWNKSFHVFQMSDEVKIIELGCCIRGPASSILLGQLEILTI